MFTCEMAESNPKLAKRDQIAAVMSQPSRLNFRETFPIFLRHNSGTQVSTKCIRIPSCLTASSNDVKELFLATFLADFRPLSKISDSSCRGRGDIAI